MQKGFTLLETLIYIALFSVLIGGVLATTYNIIEASGRNQTKTVLEQEGLFLSSKLNWALAGASTVAVVPSPPSLTINKFNYPTNPLVFDLDPSLVTLRLKEGGGAATNLNNDAVQISNLVFTDIPAASGKPEGVQASFTLTAKTPNGSALSQDFTITKYLRK